MSENIPLPQPAQKALELFPIAMNDTLDYQGPLGVAWASGRVNLIGEHTDYNDGFVLPIAIDRVVAFAGRARSDKVVRLWSSHFQEFAHFSLEGLPWTFEQQQKTLPLWACYALSVTAELSAIGVELRGFDAIVNSDVPVGGGMSSSAAIEIATAQACALFSDGRLMLGNEEATLKPIELAALCQRAEHLASGVRSGILDQAASCLGQPGQAILLDCRSLEYRYLPFDAPDLSLIVIDTSVRRELAASAYNERRRQCEEAVKLLSNIISQCEPENQSALAIRALRDVSQEQFDRYSSQLPEVLRRRAGFVIAEDARVLQASKLLEQGHIEKVGSLLWASHTGLRNEYEVSCVELDTLVEIARGVPGVLGARMLGGGFGGCTINLVRNEAIDALRQAINNDYPARTGLHGSFDICKAAGGPGMRWMNLQRRFA
jgi:galactokinase